MDNGELAQLLAGAAELQIPLTELDGQLLLRLKSEVLRWNHKINLTGLHSSAEVIEKHLLDSLAILPELHGARSLLDIGAGAGFPGLPLKVARPGLAVTLVDASSKRVGFIKHAVGVLGISSGARAIHARAAGRPQVEGLPCCDAVVSRALMGLPDWLELAAPYRTASGRVLAMLGKAPDIAELESLKSKHGFSGVSMRAYRLPFGGGQRHVVVFR